MEYHSAKIYILNKLDALSEHLTYHCKQHTLDVVASIEDIALHENISDEETHLLKVAGLLHDTGFLEKYKNHENQSCINAKNWLPQFNYSKEQIELICGMIMATKIPQMPKNKLEQIICDADLDYLGTEEYERIAETLHDEWIFYGFIQSEKEWLERQISFLKIHKYFTDYFIDVRVHIKKKVLLRLEEKRNI